MNWNNPLPCIPISTILLRSVGMNLQFCCRKTQTLMKHSCACASEMNRFSVTTRNAHCNSPSARQRPTTAVNSRMPCYSRIYACMRIKTATDRVEEKINRLMECVTLVPKNPEYTDTTRRRIYQSHSDAIFVLRWADSSLSFQQSDTVGRNVCGLVEAPPTQH